MAQEPEDPDMAADRLEAALERIATLAAVQPAGSDTHPFRGQGVTIPTLDTVLDAFPTTLFSVDLKDESLDMVAPLLSWADLSARPVDLCVTPWFRKRRVR